MNNKEKYLFWKEKTEKIQLLKREIEDLSNQYDSLEGHHQILLLGDAMKSHLKSKQKEIEMQIMEKEDSIISLYRLLDSTFPESDWNIKFPGDPEYTSKELEEAGQLKLF